MIIIKIHLPQLQYVKLVWHHRCTLLYSYIFLCYFLKNSIIAVTFRTFLFIFYKNFLIPVPFYTFLLFSQKTSKPSTLPNISFYFPKFTSDYSFDCPCSRKSPNLSFTYTTVCCELLVSKRSTIYCIGKFVSENSTGDKLLPVSDTGDETLATKSACLHLKVKVSKKSFYECKQQPNNISTKFEKLTSQFFFNYRRCRWHQWFTFSFREFS